MPPPNLDPADNPFRSPAGAASTAGGSDGGQAVTSLTVELLRQTRPWARTISVLMFLWSMLILLVGAGGAVYFAIGGRPMDVFPMLIYAVMGLLYLAPALYLFRYASRIFQLEQFGDMARLEDALEAQKSFWRFMGILTAAVVILFAILMAFVVLGAGIGAFAGR